MTSKFRPEVLPTSVIELYKKTPDKTAETTQNIAQAGIADSTESIKRYLEKLFLKFPPASPGSVLFENYKYNTPQQVVNLKHNLGRPYRGLDVIAVKCGVPYAIDLSLASNQLINVGTAANIGFFASNDPYGSFNASTSIFTMPFNAICNLSATIFRSYASGTITLIVDNFSLYSVTDSQPTSSFGVFSAISTTSTEILRYTNLVQQGIYLQTGKQYSIRFTANSMSQNILGLTNSNTTRVQVLEPGNPEPRIDSVLDASYSDAVKSVYIPILCDRACTFSAVVY